MGQAHSESDSEVALSQIQDLYRRFATECPSGNLHLHEFRRIFGFSHTSSEEESAYIETVFRSFDTNGDGHLDFLEYVAAVHLIFRGKLKDKLVWSFKVFDRDGNGSLDREEVGTIIKIIWKIKKPHEPNTSLSVAEIVDRIFTLVDKNNDCRISLDEFIEGAEKDPWVLDQLKLDLGPCEWFVEQSGTKT
ncbi:unnamed protein product [Knipowitschia caucasica]|uniref:EF-hand domain-containing protein n=1 Tax=Knipowitschia caucasica TaxID=637954 RepID=A0AAV2LLG6_KNICA